MDVDVGYFLFMDLEGVDVFFICYNFDFEVDDDDIDFYICFGMCVFVFVKILELFCLLCVEVF